MPIIQSMKIDTTNTRSKLCELSAFLMNDKGPYSINGHRHAYTGIYTLFFARFVENPVVIAELGIDSCSSMAMWYNYFKHPDSKIFGFDLDTNHINHLNSLEGENIKGLFMDVTKDDSIVNGLAQIGDKIDILLDDSSHIFEDQIRIIKKGLPFVKSGGLIIIEDIYRDRNEADYEEALKDVLFRFSFATFILPNHINEFCGSSNNSKLLVLIKK
jgi:hypothetical protein